MQIARMYSHLNGLEFLLVHKPSLWKEIQEVIAAVDAARCRTKVSKEKTMPGKLLYIPVDMNASFHAELEKKGGWHGSRTSYWVTEEQKLIRKTLELPADEQKKQIAAAGFRPIYTYNQTDFVKDRIAVEVQFGKYFSVAYDLFVKHMAFFVGDVIDVGVEIMPMKALEAEMSSGVPYYENELYNLLRQGRSTPAVPLVLIGLAP
ncbi:MAG: BglII/BstYI family type II restriction endonuclease [Armatimonadota bacterium]|nr:BglII/BstYI family type II restriction endonuclease [Armatimonadota bacterium]